MLRVSEVRLTAELGVEVIAGSQTASGGYPASPVHAVYRYGWVRDGSWCACAMDRVGQRAGGGVASVCGRCAAAS